MSIVKRFEDVELEIILDNSHEFLATSGQVALGYGVTRKTINYHKNAHPDEFIEGKHWVSSGTGRASSDSDLWTKRGMARLGFFIKSERAKNFRDWVEDLIIDGIERKISPAEHLLAQAKQLVELEKQGMVLGFRVEKNSREITEIKMKLLPEAKVTEEQAANIQEGVHTIGYMLDNENPPMGKVWGILKQKFGFAMYRELPQTKYQSVVDFLNTWVQQLSRKQI